MKLLAMNPLWLGIVFCLGCGAQERLTPEPASGVEGASSSAGASGNGNDDTWVSGSIENGAPSTSQLGDTSEGDDDEGVGHALVEGGERLGLVDRVGPEKPGAGEDPLARIPVRENAGGDRRGRLAPTAARRAIGLRDHERHLVRGRDRLQGGQPEGA